MHKFHILIVDDDGPIRDLLRRYLCEHGFLVSAASHAEEARNILEIFSFDLIVLDIMMPGENGFSFLQSFRKTQNTPVLFLSAKWEADDRVQGLELGADDYLPKPFNPKELLLRIQAILKRAPLNDGTSSQQDPWIHFGPYRFDAQRGLLWVSDERVPLSSTEVSLLRVFSLSPGKTLTREAIIDRCDIPTSPRTIDVQINRLRKKVFSTPETAPYLQTVRNMGYIFWTD